MKKVRVIHVIGKRPVGGVGTVLLNYHRHMNPDQVQMDYLIFGSEEEEFDRQVKALGAKIYSVPALSGFSETRKIMEAFLAKHCGEYDALHLHPPYIAGIVMPLAKKYGIKHRIVHSHATVYAESTIKAIRNHSLWLVSQGEITERVACSEAAGEFLFRKKPYVVMKNAIEPEKYAFRPDVREVVRSKNNIQEDQLVVGNVGRFSLQKNQTFLLDVFAELKKLEPRAVLWIAGDGETRKEVFAKVKEHGLKTSKEGPDYDVKFFGMVKNAEELYQGMDVMIMPSLFEGLPMVGVEAQASGLPVVYSDTITKEVDLVGCKYLSLEASTKTWAKDAILLAKEMSVTQREKAQYLQVIDREGFNIELEARRLEDYYQNLRK